MILGDFISAFEKHYPVVLAEPWDRVGLVVGDRTQSVQRVLLAVDITEEVARQAVAGHFDLLLTHHPLYLRGTSFLSCDDSKGRIVADLIRANCALYTAHTNADIASGGVSDSLASLVGLRHIESPEGALRVGTIDPIPLGDFAQHVAQVLPAGPTGLLVGGDPERQISRVAVSGGAGDSYLDAAHAAGADVYLAADFRHHPALEHLDHTALLCGSHWATEWPWLPRLAEQLSAWPSTAKLAVEVSTLVTEPWGAHLITKGQK